MARAAAGSVVEVVYVMSGVVGGGGRIWGLSVVLVTVDADLAL